jgi:glycosyltransferase 2 family protein
MLNAIRILAISLFFSLLGFGSLFLQGKNPLHELAQLPKMFAQLSLEGGALILAALIGWWALSGLRLALLADAVGARGSVSIWRGTQATLLSLFAAFVTPAATGASFGQAWYLSRFMQPQQATAIAVYGLVLDFIYYAWALPVSFAVLSWQKINLGISGVGPILGVLSIVASLLTLFFAWSLTNRADRVAHLVGRIFSLGFLRRFQRGAYRFVLRTAENLKLMGSISRSTQVTLHLITAIGFTLHFGALNAVAFALDITVNHPALLASQSLVVALAFIIPTPGGSGYFEAVLPRVFAAIGAEQFSTGLALIWRLLSYYLYLLIGPLIGGSALLRASEQQKKAPVAHSNNNQSG